MYRHISQCAYYTIKTVLTSGKVLKRVCTKERRRINRVERTIAGQLLISKSHREQNNNDYTAVDRFVHRFPAVFKALTQLRFNHLTVQRKST